MPQSKTSRAKNVKRAAAKKPKPRKGKAVSKTTKPKNNNKKPANKKPVNCAPPRGTRKNPSVTTRIDQLMDICSCDPPLGKKGTGANKNNIIPSKGRAPVCFYAAQGPRDSMEDTYQIMHFTIGNKKGTFYGVFDGHGGRDVSFQLVANQGGLFPFLINAIKKYPKQPIEKIMKLAYLEYDNRLFQKGLKSGSTAIVVLHYNDHLYMINLGDSRGLIFTEKDNLVKCSDDHKPWKPAERTRIYKAGHYVNPFKIYRSLSKKSYDYGDVYVNQANDKYKLYLNGGWEEISKEQYKQIMALNVDIDTHRVCNSLALSRAFGDFYLKKDKGGAYQGLQAAISPEPDVTTIPLKQYKGQMIYLFLASDGFWDVSKVTPNFRNVLRTHPQPQSLCQALVEGALKKGSTDNTTVVFDRFRV